MASASGYFRHPTVHDDTVVFVSEDDLWTVPAAGGVARRLTATAGRLSAPVLSPDGKRVAFLGQDEGPNEVYVMPAAGGVPERLTWLGGNTVPVAWQPDGKAVVFATDWRQFQMGHVHLCSAPTKGGPPRPLKVGPARAISFEPSGKGVVIGRNSGDPARWKRYRGGTAGTIWVDRGGKGDFRPLIRLAGNLASPMWIGSRIYFLSDHEGHGNLYSCTPTGRGLKRHTRHEDFYVRFPSSDGRRIVYHAGADLHLFDPAHGTSTRIEIEYHGPRAERQRKFVPASSSLESFDLHPKGNEAAVVSRGGAFRFGLWDGPVQRHGKPSRERHRLATFLSDGRRLVTVADKGGEERLVLHGPKPGERKREIEGDFGRVLDLVVAPGEDPRVAIANHRQEVLVVDTKTRRTKQVAKSAFDRIGGMAWSADGRYLAYAKSVSHTAAQIEVWDSRTGRRRAVTRPDFRDSRPVFDPEGRYLYFLSVRVFDPVYDGVYFDLGFPRGVVPCLVTLQKDLPSPFAAAQRSPRAAEGVAEDAPEPKGKRDDKQGVKKVRIEFDGIEDRVLAFPVGEGRYRDVQAGPERVFFSSLPVEGALGVRWWDQGEPPAKAVLEAWDFEKVKKETVYQGVTSFQVSRDGKSLAVRVGNRLRVLPAGKNSDGLSKEVAPGPASGWVDLGRLRVEVRPAHEWRQMFGEAWRLQRDHYWTPDMAGIDWRGVRERYGALIDRVSCRSEFSDLLWEMQGELGTSHCYELGGDYRPSPAWHQGFLGADLELRKKTGAWVVARIPRGDSWEALAASPLAAPGVSVAVGDELLAVNGVAVGSKLSPYEALVHRAGQAVTLTLRNKAGKKRSATVETLPQEYVLRYRDWVEANRARVHRESKGRVGYVHIPDMGPRGFSEFHRYYLQEVEHEGLIVDVRFNGGGHVSQLLLQKLLRRRIGYDCSRWAPEPASYPSHAPMGPMVALTNEYAGSDGDMFSHAFKLTGLGPLIGKRTWGGVVGIWPRHALVDGTVTTQPEFATWFQDVGWGVENYGTDPDVEVEIRPQDHAAGKDPQLERALVEIEGIRKREKPRVPTLGDGPNLKPPKLEG